MILRFRVIKKIRQWLVVDTQRELEDFLCGTREEARQKARELNARSAPSEFIERAEVH